MSLWPLSIFQPLRSYLVFDSVNPALNLDQAHLTELSEEQAKYMGLSKTGGFLTEMARK